ncbi:hypothetical protein HWA77_15180 [Photobacterium damselae subsp. damselae]|uniref:Uncharacterized protein n=1 Tax=Photobacterium damselae subsp. damselae TaxID=85581 RepID=A0A850QZK3_PHODD|nr:hypothetical protein [Photobacterium damselae subsp. damselae]
MNKVFSIFRLPFPVYIDKSALGESFEITISNISGFLHTPFLPKWKTNELDPLRKCLLPPRVAKTWKQGNEQIFWGKPHSYPMGDSLLYSILFEFHTDEPSDDSELIYNTFTSWVNLLLDYIEIFTNQNARIDPSKNIYGDQILLFKFSEDGSSKGIPNNKVITITSDNWQKHIDIDSFSKACNLASIGSPPTLPYKLYIEANRAYLQKDYRKAVIECGAAIEQALTIAIIDLLEDRGYSESEIQRKLNGNKTLGGRFNLASDQLEIDVLTHKYDYRSILVDSRNEAIHDASFTSQSIARYAINFTQELLSHIVPEINET